MKMTTLRDRWDRREWGLGQIGIYMTDDERTKQFNREALKYCSQNKQECLTCSLVNYMMDCHNNKIVID